MPKLATLELSDKQTAAPSLQLETTARVAMASGKDPAELTAALLPIAHEVIAYRRQCLDEAEAALHRLRQGDPATALPDTFLGRALNDFNHALGGSRMGVLDGLGYLLLALSDNGDNERWAVRLSNAVQAAVEGED